MIILVAGKDQTSEIKQRISAAILRGAPGAAPKFPDPAISALALREAESESDYLARLLTLIRYRDAVDTFAFEIPRKPGFMQRMLAQVRSFLWRALRYQHDRIAFRQNLINGLFTSALEFELL